MPSSEPNNLSLMVSHLMRFKHAKRIVDCGIGCGKWGHFVREYLDGHWNGRKYHDPTTWKIVLIGYELFSPYVTDWHKMIYDRILIADYYTRLMDTTISIDLCIMGDSLEHIDKQKGVKLLSKKNIKAFLISTPNWDCRHKEEQSMVFGNEAERHVSYWKPGDFFNLGFKTESVTQGRLITACLER